LLRIPNTKLQTTEQVYMMAGTENEVLNHIRILHDNIEANMMTSLEEGVRNCRRPRIS